MMTLNLLKQLTASVVGAALISVVGGVQSAEAITIINEVEPNGNLGNAQDVGTLGIDDTQIRGRISAARRGVDLFSFNWIGGQFKANTNGSNPGLSEIDTQLFLFDDLGRFITGDDDTGLGLNSLISTTLAAGNYFLGITDFDNDPLFDVNGILAGWSNDGEAPGGQYVINVEAVPEPLTVLGSLAAVGIGTALKKKQAKQDLKG